MDSARWERIQSIFHDAADRPESERQTFLDAACGGDAELMAEVRSLLKGDSRGAPLLDGGLPEIAYRILGEPEEALLFQEVGPYRLIRILGKGGMGVVGLAEREDTGRPVAIKFLLHAGMTPARRDRFAREIKTLAKLRHPFIARLYDAGALADGTPWFVMEYVEGQPFTDYCRQQPRPVEDQLRLFRSVCEAVQYAHGQEVIHRDLKPSNILVEKDGTPRLLDFGIARELNDPGEPGDHPDSTFRFLSPDYAAPEWERDGIVGAYTDVYSLGVMLYEILAGRRPFERSKIAVAGGQNPVVDHLPDKPSTLADRSLSRRAWNDLDALCLKALHHDVRERYGSVEALIRDIDHYLKEEPLEARAGTVPYRLGKFVRRNRRPVLAASLVFTLIVALVVFFTVRLTHARNVALAEAARTRRVEQFMLNLFESGTREAAYSKDLRALTLLDRGVKEAGALNSDPETQAELYESLGSIYDMLANFEESDRLLFLALDRMKAAVGPDHRKVAEILLRIGVLRGDQSRLTDAVRFSQEGLAMAERHAPANDLLVIEAKSVLARVTAQGGSYGQAIAILEPLVKIQASGEEAAYTLADDLLMLGVCYYSTGRLDAAESFERRALALHRQLGGVSDPHTANDLFNLGQIQAARSHYADAEKLYREAIRITEGWYGPDHPDAATLRGVFARTLMFQGKYGEAEGLLQRVLEIQQKAYHGTDVRIAVTLDSLGRIALKRGDLAGAAADFSRALEIAQSLLGEANYVTAVAKADLGEAHLRQGRYVLAEDELREAVGRLSAALPPGDAHTGAAQLSWGRALLRLKRYADAEKQLAPGYATLAKQPQPDPAQLQEARQSLGAVYDALQQPDKAAGFR